MYNSVPISNYACQLKNKMGASSAAYLMEYLPNMPKALNSISCTAQKRAWSMPVIYYRYTDVCIETEGQ